jgi:DNA-binding CsgD family transcriptional regulator
MVAELELLRLIDLIYQGALDAECWANAIAAIGRAFGGEVSSLSLYERPSRALRYQLELDDESFRQSYAELAAAPDMDPVWRMTEASLLPTGVLALDVARRNSLVEETRFYAEWLRPQRVEHILMALLAPSANLVGGLFLARTTRSSPFADDELAALRSLHPHLGRAVQVRLRLEAASAAERQALEALEVVEQAVLLVDAHAAVRHANRAAEALLRTGGLKTVAGALACDNLDDTRALRRLIGGASTGRDDADCATLAVRRRSRQRPLSVLVAPLRGEHPFQLQAVATAVLLVADPEQVRPAADVHLQALYGLTQAEARTAQALLDADRLADVADNLGVTLSTVRTHLQRAFEKTATRRQSELVRLLLAHRLPPAGSTGPRTVNGALATTDGRALSAGTA